MRTQADPLASYRAPLLAELRRAASQLSHHSLLRYDLGLEGERVEGDRLLAGCVCLAVTDTLGGAIAPALPVAVATELLRNLALIQSDLHFQREHRDGRTTLARRWGVPLALNSEDGLFALAQVVLARLPEAGVPPAVAAVCQRHFDGAVLRLCERLPAWGRSSAPAEDIDTPIELAGAVGTPLGAGVAAAAAIAGAAAGCGEALVDYGEALGTLLALTSGSDAAALSDLSLAAASALDRADLGAAEAERLRGLVRFIGGGTK
jgi:geranylgeranyl pyrophosphate synthase